MASQESDASTTSVPLFDFDQGWGGLDGRDFPSMMPEQHLSLSLIRVGGLDGRDFPSLTPLVISLL